MRASNNLGIVLTRDGELDRAKKLFENTLQENPDFIFGHINLAELFLNNGGVERAYEEIKETLDIVKDSNDSDINLDYIYYLDGRIKIEAQSKENEIQLKDKEIQLKDTNGKYSEAVKSFEKALSFNVEDPGLILWSVYAKYLCQKFETNGQTNSSEESKTDKKIILPKSENISSDELFHSIACDLTKVLYFCNLPVTKKGTRESLHWIDQLIHKMFKLKWLFGKARSYVMFLVSNQSFEPQIEEKEYLIKFDKYNKIKAYTLYLLGYFYFKLQDYTTAKEKLQECRSLKPDSKTDKAARELLANIWKHKIKPPFWTYWFNSPVKTWRRRAFGTFIILGILLILFIHVENPQPVALNNFTSNYSKDFIPDQMNIYPYIISYYPSNNIFSEPTGAPSNVNNASSNTNKTGNEIINDGNNNTTWNILTPTKVNIYPDIPIDNFFDALLLLILILILISPSIRITETITVALNKGMPNVNVNIGPIETPPEFNFELTPSLMLDVIKRLEGPCP